MEIPSAVTVVGEAKIVLWVAETAPAVNVTVAMSVIETPSSVPLMVMSSAVVLVTVAV